MTGEKVLVVDDDRGLLSLMRARLEAVGYEVSGAESGEQALAFAQEHVLNAAIVDLKMEGMDGIDLLDELQPAPGLAVLRRAPLAVMIGGLLPIAEHRDQPEDPERGSVRRGQRECEVPEEAVR